MAALAAAQKADKEAQRKRWVLPVEACLAATWNQLKISAVMDQQPPPLTT